MKGLLRDLPPNSLEETAGGVYQCCIETGGLPGLGYRGITVAVDHHQHTLRQVAEIIGEIAVEPAHHRAMRKIAVATEGQFAQQKIARRVDPISLDEDTRRDAVAEGFRHLLAFDGPPAMGEYAARRLKPRCHQKRRPIDRVVAHDILTYYVKNGRPED